MKKGFTLVELLAVIIILGILSIVIVPKVINTLNVSEEKTNMASAKGLLKAAEYKYQDNEIKGISENITIDYTNNQNTNKLDYSGKKPEKGQVNILKNGRIAISVKIGEKCYSKNYNSSEITINPYNEETCGKLIKIVTTGDGLYESTIEPERLIYKGKNPNNYITLNEGTASSASNITYRIISYEADGTIKVIRDASIGTKAYDERDSNDTTTGPRHNEDNTFCNYEESYKGCNVWGNLSNTFYNGSPLGSTFYYRYYANNTNAELTASLNTGTVTVDSTLNQYLNNTWIVDKEMSKYIDSHDFNVGGIYYTPSYTGGDKGLQKEKTEEKLYTWKGKIGLMNITDYAEASTGLECTSVYSNFYYNPNYYYESSQHLTEYDGWPCSNREYNWMSKAITEWSMSPYSHYMSHAWTVNSTGSFDYHSAYISYEIRPTFYLKSSVKLGGTGTESDPYYIVN